MAIYIKEAAKSSYMKNGKQVFRFEVSADTKAELAQFIEDAGSNLIQDSETGRTLYLTCYPKFRAGKLYRTRDGRWFPDTSQIDILEAQIAGAKSPVLAQVLANKLVELTTAIPSDFREGRFKTLDDSEEVDSELAGDADDMGVF